MLTIDLKSAFYGNKQVLADVGFKIQPGQLVAILGDNGSGKTTLLKSIAGVHKTWQGKCQWDDKDLEALPLLERASAIAYLSQTTQSNFPFQVREIITLARFRFREDSKTRDRMVLKAAEQFAVSDLLERRANELSGGEQQRVMLARVFAQESAVALLDEPTAHLDLSHRLAVFQSFRKLCGQGISILCATHDLDASLEYADQLLLLQKGKPIDFGPVDEVVDRNGLTQLFRNAPVEWKRNPFSKRPQVVIHSSYEEKR
ncbi:MAG: ABC transporter ATP-binding protein [Verrucomicrobiota bacterium]